MLSFDSCVAMSDAREHLKKHVLMGNVSTWTLEFGIRESGTVSSQMLERWFRDYFYRHVVWEQNHHLRIFRQSDRESGKQQKKKLKSERKTVNYEMTMKNMKRENLLEKLRKEGRFVENPCNGKGICGKCKVKILSGDAGEVTETEKHFLSEEELAGESGFPVWSIRKKN